MYIYIYIYVPTLSSASTYDRLAVSPRKQLQGKTSTPQSHSPTLSSQLARESLGSINFKGLTFLSELGDRLTAATDEPQGSIIPVPANINPYIQRFNAVSFQRTFIQPEDVEF